MKARLLTILYYSIPGSDRCKAGQILSLYIQSINRLLDIVERKSIGEIPLSDSAILNYNDQLAFEKL